MYHVPCPTETPLGISTVSLSLLKTALLFLLYSAPLLALKFSMGCYLCPIWSVCWGSLDVLGMGESPEKVFFFFVWSEKPFLFEN